MDENGFLSISKTADFAWNWNFHPCINDKCSDKFEKFLFDKQSFMVKSHFIYVDVTKNQLLTYEIDTSHGFKLMTAPILICQGASLLQVSPTYHVLTLRFKSGCRSPLPPLFSCEFCKKSKNTFSCRTPLVAASLFVIYSNNTQIERTLA